MKVAFPFKYDSVDVQTYDVWTYKITWFCVKDQFWSGGALETFARNTDLLSFNLKVCFKLLISIYIFN